MQHKYPLVVLHLEISPEFLDVNVHPTKMELRFRGEREIYEFLVGVVRDALLGKELIPKVSLTEDPKENVKDKSATEAAAQPKAEPFEKNLILPLCEGLIITSQSLFFIKELPDVLISDLIVTINRY